MSQLPDISRLPKFEPPPDFYDNPNMTRFQPVDLTASSAKPAALFPHFNPPLQSQFSYRRWFSLVFRTSDNSLRGPFDVDGAKPKCYSLHATTVEIESPLFSPEEIARLVRSVPPDPSGIRVSKVAPDTIVKAHLSADEAITETLNLSMIDTMTTIPVPDVREVVVNAEPRLTYLVMEYIDGQTLDICWNSLTLLSKLRIAWTLRSYVTQLRRLRRTVPGTLNGILCTGRHFTDYGAGPFASYDDMTAWFNHKLDVSQRMKQAPLDAPRFDSSWPLVFVHQDLCPRNILLARDGKLYVLDWHRSGFYPAWFEYASMRSDLHFKSRLWDFLIPFISHTISIRTRQLVAEYQRNIGWALSIGAFM